MRRKLSSYSKYKPSGIEWLGEIPEGWNIHKLKYIANANFSGVDKHTLDGEVSVRLCNYVDVYYNNFITADINFMQATATPTEITKFTLKGGDVIITKDSEGWDDIAIPAYISSDMEGVLCGYHLAQIRPNTKRVDGKFLFWSFCSPENNDQFKIAATGITRYGLGKYWLDNGLFPIPTLDEQHAITVFLDRETERIDGLIEKKEQQIELLQEKRTAIISQTVTKGLDPNAKMKDSGIEWLGEVPEGWKIRRLKYVAHIQTGNTPSKKKEDNYCEDGTPWVKPDDLGSFVPIVETKEELSVFGVKAARIVPKEAILVCCIGSIGKMGIAGCLLTTNQQINALIFNNDINNDYAAYLIYSTESEHQGYANCNVVKILNSEKQGDIILPIPELHEQRVIAAFLDHETERIDGLIDKVKNSIDLLREYRTALISAAVTGKIDVRKEVA